MAITGLMLFGVAPLSSGNGDGLAPSTDSIVAKDIAAIVRVVPYEHLEVSERNLDEYERVIDAVFERQTVLPAPFGSVFRNADHVARWLQMHYITLTEAIHLIEGRCEARLHVRADTPSLAEEPDPVLLEQATELFRAMSREADTAVMLRRPSAHALVSGAFLMDRSEWEAFAEVGMTQARRVQGLAVELSGPWPPYDFVRMDLGA